MYTHSIFVSLFLRSVQESATSYVSAPAATLSTDSVDSKSANSETSDAEEELDLWVAHDSQSANIDPSETADSRSQTHVVSMYEQHLNSYLKEPRLPRMKPQNHIRSVSSH
ncbi:hypothetical protein ACJMK2_042472 [Sinanodonta woodiana]|uniref:Uncharacterized protein n=1 Tax=Sinanodonta woodiana TaxID=1069815 RepID=A0ABD3W7G0_SINWO